MREPLASRPDEKVLVGVVLRDLSSDFRSTQAENGIATVVNGSVVEVSWRAARAMPSAPTCSACVSGWCLKATGNSAIPKSG
jgi:hypothetical protein